ncbi:hypothetical protein ACFL21_01995 [Patescibacteria group bacterium]
MNKQKKIKEQKEIKEFLQIVDEIAGFYFDTISAYDEFLKLIMNAQQFVSNKTSIAIKDLDILNFKYENNKNSCRHTCTQGELKKRLEKNSDNYKKIGNLCLILIYQYWDNYRNKIEKKLQLQKNEIKSDIMGDIRILRNSILKNKSRGKPDVENCKILKWFKKGKKIIINEKQFEKILNNIKNFLLEYS